MNVARHSLVMAFLALSTAAAMPALAQDSSNRSGNRSNDNSSTAQQSEVGKPKVQAAQVGAGTTNGSTTGTSGPKSNSGNAPGQIQVPPLPNPSLCDPYKDTPAAYQACLWVSLKD
ncbi:hypothetical protein [Microvirga splendida]|uniref:Uncharacterized protein n=1 Tax=Microvirga splendida TaxID=2795727 RepID=A0ABS0Y501_9HYPH|nr:hypothetical protein [Microvirga splendida]MBJ6127010.1 hypothetical protein [Microvirga splendida]